MTSSRNRRNSPAASVFADKLRTVVAAIVVGMARLGLRDYRAEVDADGVVVSERGYHHNLFFRTGPGGTRISGSLRRWAAEVGVVPLDQPFGPEEAGLTFDALDALLGWGRGTVRSGRLTYLEYAADLLVRRPAREFVEDALPSAKTTLFLFGGTNCHHHTKRHTLVLYAKWLELWKKGRAATPPPEDRDLLRVEDRRRDVPEFLDVFRDGHDVVRVGLLADPAFRDELARRWAARARQIEFRRGVRYDTPPSSGTERIRRRALERINELGGVEAEVARVRAEAEAGLVTNAESQIRALRALARDPRLSAPSDLAAEFAVAVDAVAGPPPAEPSRRPTRSTESLDNAHP